MVLLIFTRDLLLGCAYLRLLPWSVYVCTPNASPRIHPAKIAKKGKMPAVESGRAEQADGGSTPCLDARVKALPTKAHMQALSSAFFLESLHHCIYHPDISQVFLRFFFL